jgi:hypothetical protein
LEKEGALCLAK